METVESGYSVGVWLQVESGLVVAVNVFTSPGFWLLTTVMVMRESAKAIPVKVGVRVVVV